MIYHTLLAILPAASPTAEMIRRLDYLFNPAESFNNVTVNIGNLVMALLGRVWIMLAVDGFDGIAEVGQLQLHNLVQMLPLLPNFHFHFYDRLPKQLGP